MFPRSMKLHSMPKSTVCMYTMVLQLIYHGIYIGLGTFVITIFMYHGHMSMSINIFKAM